MKLLKCVNSLEKFNPDVFRELDIGVEIQAFAKPNIYEGDYLSIVEQYKRVLQDFPNIIALHGPFIDLKPISPDNQIRKITYQKYLTTLEIAEQLKANYVIFHSQINPWLNNYNKEYFLKANQQFFNQLLSETNYSGSIVLENIFDDDPIQLKTLIDYLANPQIKVCLDIGHANIRNSVSLKEWIEVLGDRIIYMHLHENDGINDLHNPLSEETLILIKQYLTNQQVSPILAIEYETNDLVKEIERFRKY